VAGGPFGGFGPRGVIHAVTVVPNSSGGFDTVTIDSGTLESVSGDELTITEGTKSATYATPTITVPSDATVLLDGSSSTRAALPYGDRVTITQNSDGTSKVFATDASFAPRLGGGPGRRGGFGPRRGGPALGATGSTAFWPPPGSTGPWHHGPGHDVPLWGSSGSSAGPTT
jgi:hypothetical protein